MNINWNLAPEGAVAIKRTRQGKMFFENSKGEYYHGGWKSFFCDKWKTIATRPTKKTVADAPHFKATRENLEQVAKDCEGGFFEVQEGEKWTHYTEEEEGLSTRCRKHLQLSQGDDWVYVCELGEYFVPGKMGYCGVKPIKPKLTKAQAWDMLCKKEHEFDIVNKIKSEYDITD